jgi:hypothetical protein
VLCIFVGRAVPGRNEPLRTARGRAFVWGGFVRKGFSCLRAIYAAHVVMPMSELTCPMAGREPGGEVGIRTRTDPGSQAAADGLAGWGLPLTSKSERATGTRRHARVSSTAVSRR